jgi:hypothetical protein
MSWSPDPKWIQRWYPKRWSEIAGNAAMIQVWINFLANGPCNALFTGMNRTGKTRTVYLGVRALVCTKRTATHDPCGECEACRALGDGTPELWGTFKHLCGSPYSLITIDCETVTAEELRELPHEGKLDGDVIVYLDEIAALRRRRLEGMLLKLIDETRAVWIASAISLKRKKGSKKGQWTERMSKEMKGRFAIKVGSSLAHPDDLSDWIESRSQEWNITILEPEVTIPAMIKRALRRVGYLIHMFAFAATRKSRTLSLDDVNSFNLDAED